MNNIEKELLEIEKALEILPPGELKAYTNNGSYRWYYINGQARQYLSKANRTLAEKLAMKKYYLLKKNYLLETKGNLESQLLSQNTAQKKFEKFLQDESYQELLRKNISNVVADWENQDYKTNPHYTEQCNVPCPSGHKVRSKSEAFIDMVLNNYGIMFRYESELVIGKQTYYPDFTLINPNTNEIVYWEHFGKMDDADYARAAFNKMKTYYEYGLVPGKNVIFTFETRHNPFTYSEAEAALVLMKL